jgi:nucleotide-binding universal stress UspA family protein
MTEFYPQQILLTTDLSPDSALAYPHAIALAKTYGASLTILCCVDTSLQFGIGGAFDMPVVYVPEALTAVKERAVKDLQAHVAEHFSGITVHQRVEEAPQPVQNTIVDFIRKNPVDMVVLASHGRSGISRAFLGSVAEQVIRHCPKPVLVVPTTDK